MKLRLILSFLTLLIGLGAFGATNVTNVGGVFLNSKNNKALAEWYQKNFGFDMQYNKDENSYYYLIHLNPGEEFPKGKFTVFSIHHYDGTDEIGRNQVMINFQVKDIARTVAHLKANGSEVKDIADYGYGKFTWLSDLDGNRLEIWEANLDWKP